ncbi:hypothetical protein [Agromyces sp. PvR057]|uniref:hypothetical protein n=1 Tax=Agromyces sp. PvR057 TaxID=3156403 RepID=UPI0033923FB3
MTDTRPLLDALHEATHRVPGVPAHVSRPAGHHGDARNRTAHTANTALRGSGRTRNHTPARPPRVLVSWQRRIAAFFGQQG